MRVKYILFSLVVLAGFYIWLSKPPAYSPLLFSVEKAGKTNYILAVQHTSLLGAQPDNIRQFVLSRDALLVPTLSSTLKPSTLLASLAHTHNRWTHKFSKEAVHHIETRVNYVFEKVFGKGFAHTIPQFNFSTVYHWYMLSYLYGIQQELVDHYLPLGTVHALLPMEELLEQQTLSLSAVSPLIEAEAKAEREGKKSPIVEAMNELRILYETKPDTLLAKTALPEEKVHSQLLSQQLLYSYALQNNSLTIIGTANAVDVITHLMSKGYIIKRADNHGNFHAFTGFSLSQ